MWQKNLLTTWQAGNYTTHMWVVPPVQERIGRVYTTKKQGEPGMEAHACDHRILEAEAGGFHEY